MTIFFPSNDGEDEYGDPVTTWRPEAIDGALVYELAGTSLVDIDRPGGMRVYARIQLPDEYMAGLGRDALKGCRIALTGRGQTEDDAYWIVGSPNYAPSMPTRWNTTLEAGRKDG